MCHRTKQIIIRTNVCPGADFIFFSLLFDEIMTIYTLVIGYLVVLADVFFWKWKYPQSPTGLWRVWLTGAEVRSIFRGQRHGNATFSLLKVHDRAPFKMSILWNWHPLQRKLHIMFNRLAVTGNSRSFRLPHYPLRTRTIGSGSPSHIKLIVLL